MRKAFFAIFIAASPILAWGGYSYTIETSYNDEFFIINGEKYEAKAYCFDMEEEDEVVFIEGSPLGVCVSATVVNLRTRDRCELWCE